MDFCGFPQHPHVNVTIDKGHSIKGSEGAAGKQKYSSAPSLTSALDGGGG
jgi:hypothetical protein